MLRRSDGGFQLLLGKGFPCGLLLRSRAQLQLRAEGCSLADAKLELLLGL